MVATKLTLKCPVCGVREGGGGQPFRSIRSLSLHIVGKAKTWRDDHEGWIRDSVPDVNLVEGTINQVADQIEFHVVRATGWGTSGDDRGELPAALRKALKEAFSGQRPTDERSEEELESYLAAYAYIWDIETKLHSTVARILKHALGELWMEKGFPLPLKEVCVIRQHEDSNQAPGDCYIYLLELGEIIQHNKEIFQTIFEKLRSSSYKDPGSSFYQQLQAVSKIRNGVMHPLKKLTPSPDKLSSLKRFREFIQRLGDVSSS